MAYPKNRIRVLTVNGTDIPQEIDTLKGLGKVSITGWVEDELGKTIERHVTSTGYRTAPIDWDGRDDFGSRIGRGVYIYRVKVRTSLGQTAEKIEKLVILN